MKLITVFSLELRISKHKTKDKNTRKYQETVATKTVLQKSNMRKDYVINNVINVYFKPNMYNFIRYFIDNFT